MLFQALGIISEPTVNLNWSYGSENAQFGSKSIILWAAWPWNLTNESLKNNRAPLLISSTSFVHSFIRICEFNLEFSLCTKDSELAVQKLIFKAGLKEKLAGPAQFLVAEGLGPALNAKTGSYGLKMAKLGFDLCVLDLWPLTFCMNLISVINW